MLKKQTTQLLLFAYLITAFLIPNSSECKIDPPDYNFTLEQLLDFAPGKTKESVDQKSKFAAELFRKKGDFYIYQYPIRYSGYNFAIYVQYYNNEVTDFFTRLPNYFIHDLFHQSLINRYGKQDQYLKKDNSAVYIWNNENGLKMIYNGSCTITCFPIFYSVQKITLPAGTETILEQFQKGSNFN